MKSNHKEMEKFTLYHGTDNRMVTMSIHERAEYLEHCNKVVNELYPWYVPLLKSLELERLYKDQIDKEGEPYLYHNLVEKLSMIEARNNGNGRYQYGSLYLTNFKPYALDYARRSYAGGELGLCAYRLIQGCEIVFPERLQGNSEILQSVNIIKDFAKEGKEKPVIVVVEDIKVKYLTLDDGTELEDFMISALKDNKGVLNMRCNKEVCLSKCKRRLVNEEFAREILRG